jgi:hypothetical protein
VYEGVHKGGQCVKEVSVRRRSVHEGGQCVKEVCEGGSGAVGCGAGRSAAHMGIQVDDAESAAAVVRDSSSGFSRRLTRTQPEPAPFRQRDREITQRDKEGLWIPLLSCDRGQLEEQPLAGRDVDVARHHEEPSGNACLEARTVALCVR